MRISLTAVSGPKGQTDGNPLFEAAGLWDNCGHLQKWRERKRGRAPEGSRRDTFGDISSSLASYGAIKTNNRTEPPNQQNQTLRYGRKAELSAKKPSVDNPDVLHSRAMFFYFFKQLCKLSP